MELERNMQTEYHDGNERPDENKLQLQSTFDIGVALERRMWGRKGTRKNRGKGAKSYIVFPQALLRVAA